MKQLFAIGLCVLILPVFAALALGDSPATPTTGIRQVHDIHAENGIECETCHENVPDATGLTGLLPSMDTCANCHDVEDEDNCKMCHLGEEPTGYPEEAASMSSGMTELAHFPHQSHIQKQELNCSDCHAPDGKGGQTFPQHPQCRSCHATAAGFTDCSMCHGANQAPVPQSHGPQWMSEHALDATFDQNECESCHTQTDCQDCHNGDNVRPRVHDLNFSFSHALEARSNQMLCQTCHEDPVFCSSCHAAEQVLPENHSRADWVTSRHGVEASFNLESCIACHDAGEQDPTCARCHGR